MIENIVCLHRNHVFMGIFLFIFMFIAFMITITIFLNREEEQLKNGRRS